MSVFPESTDAMLVSGSGPLGVAGFESTGVEAGECEWAGVFGVFSISEEGCSMKAGGIGGGSDVSIANESDLDEISAGGAFRMYVERALPGRGPSTDILGNDPFD